MRLLEQQIDIVQRSRRASSVVSQSPPRKSEANLLSSLNPASGGAEKEAPLSIAAEEEVEEVEEAKMPSDPGSENSSPQKGGRIGKEIARAIVQDREVDR